MEKLKLMKWAEERFPPIDLNENVGAVIELINEIKALRQNYVSGNEANPSLNKKDGEVAVAFADWMIKKKCEYDQSWWSVGDKDFKKDFYNSKELYEIFKSETAKATDR